jgi:4-oxalocrotonate tautomerase
MPYLSFQVSTDVSQTQSDQIASVLTELTATVLGKKRELTSVEINSTSPKNWYIAGKSLAEHSLVTFYLDIKVTEGTNTKNEKSDYVQRVFESVGKIFGPLAPASYIVIHEVHADS